MDVPFAKSWWVVPGRLLGGCYPGNVDPDGARHKLGRLLDAGIRAVVCLQETDEHGAGGRPFAPYVATLEELADERGVTVRCEHYPIRDGGVPTPEHMRAILDAIDRALEEDLPVYVHCWGGHGRTGTVVGCWLVRHGRSGEEALEHITELRASRPELSWTSSPENPTQCDMVRSWEREGRGEGR